MKYKDCYQNYIMQITLICLNDLLLAYFIGYFEDVACLVNR